MIELEVYKINTQEERFDYLDTFQNATEMVFQKKLTGIGLSTFTLSLHDKKAKLENLRTFGTVFLLKQNGYPLWVGSPSSWRASIGNEGEAVFVKALSYEAHLQNRYVLGEFFEQSKEASTLFWDLVLEVQARDNGYLGIDTSSLGTIGNIQKTLENSALYTALINQSDNINGFDFILEPVLNADKKLESIRFNLQKRIGSVRNDLPPLTIENIYDVSYETASPKLNFIVGRSYGSGESVLQHIEQDLGAMVANTRREHIEKFSDITVAETLENKIKQQINLDSGENYLLSFLIKPESVYSSAGLQLGDTINLDLKVDGTLINTKSTGRIVELDYRIDENGSLSIKPVLDFSL